MTENQLFLVMKVAYNYLEQNSGVDRYEQRKSEDELSATHLKPMTLILRHYIKKVSNFRNKIIVESYVCLNNFVLQCT